MNKIVNTVLTVAMTAFIASCMPTKNMADSEGVITPLADSAAIRPGSIVYALPRTVFDVVVEMERTLELPGPYAQYAEDLLGLSNVIKVQRELWTIRSITFKSREEIDPSQYYVIGSSTRFRTNVLTLRKEGLILDLNPANFGPEEKQSFRQTGQNGISELIASDLGADEYFQVQRDTAYRRLNIDSSFVRVPYIVEKKKKLATDQLADKAAKRLMELRDGKHAILTGEANVFPQSDAAIKEMNRLEKQYTELFSGKILSETVTTSYKIIPVKSMAGKQVTLFNFSQDTGPADAKAATGVPVIIEFVPEKTTGGLNILTSGDSKSDKKFSKLYYRVPDVAAVRISKNGEKLFDSRKLIYQFGQLIQLPENYNVGR